MHQKTQSHFLKFSMHLSVRKSRENYRKIYGKSKASLWRNLSTGTPPKYFRAILCFVAVLRKLFDIISLYKHCNFSRVCLLVKMASKTVTRSIEQIHVKLQSLLLYTWSWNKFQQTIKSIVQAKARCGVFPQFYYTRKLQQLPQAEEHGPKAERDEKKRNSLA